MPIKDSIKAPKILDSRVENRIKEELVNNNNISNHNMLQLRQENSTTNSRHKGIPAANTQPEINTTSNKIWIPQDMVTTIKLHMVKVD